MIEGELEVTMDGVAHVAREGLVAIIPGGILHSVKALSDGKAIIVDSPLRRDLGRFRIGGPAALTIVRLLSV